MKDYLRIIGDVHGLVSLKRKDGRNKGKNYMNVAQAAEYSIQLGDMAFDYSDLNKLDPLKHTFFGGNHDNYDVIASSPHNLGDYGETSVGGVDFFFCRGGFSIDKKYRVTNEQMSGHKTWWQEEQLSYADGMMALKLYEKTKPSLMITHTCPTVIAGLIGNPQVLANFGYDPATFNTMTQRLLQAMFEAHQPKVWVFGHFHRNWEQTVNGTKFICIDELAHLTLNEDGEIV